MGRHEPRFIFQSQEVLAVRAGCLSSERRARAAPASTTPCRKLFIMWRKGGVRFTGTRRLTCHSYNFWQEIPFYAAL